MAKKVVDISNEELKAKLEKEQSVKRGYKVIAVVAVAAGLYGYRVGRINGYAKGVKDGYVLASEEIIGAWKEQSETIMKAVKSQ